MVASTKLSLAFAVGIGMLVGTVVSIPTARAATYYISPSGSGSSCTNGSPCSLSTALSTAGSGDTIMFKDGVYGNFTTQTPGVTYEAQNRRMATVEWQTGATNAIRIKHSNTTVRALKIDGKGEAKGVIAIQPSGGKNDYSNIVIEDNHVLNGYSSGIKIGRGTQYGKLEYITVRDNLVEAVGLGDQPTCKGECIYLNHATDDTCEVWYAEIYNNHCKDFTHNGIDLKQGVFYTEVHHNIFENQHEPLDCSNGLESTLVTHANSTNNEFHHNIIRNIDAAGPAILNPASKGIWIHDNVIMDVDGSGTTYSIGTREQGDIGSTTVVEDNYWCNVANKGANVLYGMIIDDNWGLTGSEPDCESAADAILAAMGSGGATCVTNNQGLANCETLIASSGPLDPSFPVSYLYDGCTDTAQQGCSATVFPGSESIFSFQVVHDFGALYDLTSARLFGDANGNWVSDTWTLEYSDDNSSYSTAFSGENANTNDWVTESLTGITARYVRVTVANAAGGGAQARELEVYGSLAPPSCVTNNAGIANCETLLSSSGPFGVDHPVGLLYDGCTDGGDPGCSGVNFPGNVDITSFGVVHDFGALYDLTSARLFGDANGNWVSDTWTLEYSDDNSSYTTAFSGANALVNDWVTQSLTGITARYVRVTVSNSAGSTQARELEVYGTVAPSGPDCTGASLLSQSSINVNSTSSGSNNPGANMLDNDSGTYWKSSDADDTLPQWIVFDLGSSRDTNEIRWLPRQNGNSYCKVDGYEAYVSDTVGTWGSAVASGNLASTDSEKTITYTCASGRYIMFKATSTHDRRICGAEFNVVGN